MRLLIISLACCAALVPQTVMKVRRASGPTPATCGQTSIGAGNDVGDTSYYISGASCVPASASTVVDCQVYTGTVGGDVNCAVYDSDGAGGTPFTLVCQGTQTASVATSWNVVPMSGYGTLAGSHTY